MSAIVTVVTVIFVAISTGYIRTRMANLATSHDLKLTLTQLKENTDVIEGIKSKLNEEYWVKQQIWDIKRQAYEEILSCLYLTKEYIERQRLYLRVYIDCFVNVGYVTFDFEDTEEHQISYNEYIKSEQEQFNKNYGSEIANAERQELSKNTRNSLKKLESVFSIKSIYLHAELKSIEILLGQVHRKIYEDDPSQECDESTSDFLERLFDNYMENGERLNDIILKTRDLAVKDLKLTI